MKTMTLEEYRIQENLTYLELAEKLGLPNKMTAWRYCKMGRIPKPEVMEIIVKISGGAVQPNDFYDFLAP